MSRLVALTAPFIVIATVGHSAETTASGDPEVSPVEVTATRIPETTDRVPNYITVLDGADLRARRVTDLRGALATVAGVEAPPGGDAGPASAVPSFWGLHEFDAFLLVVDGVPLGGALNPAIQDVSLVDVQRIEVLKGAAPVLYGATAFVGVIQVIHYPAGQAANRVSIGGGAYGSVRGEASISLPEVLGLRQSLALAAGRNGFSDPRQRVKDARLLYRAGGELLGGQLRLDLDYTALRTRPGSPVDLEGTALTAATPLDANYNPKDARIDEDRYHAVLGYAHATVLGAWETTVSLAYSRIDDVRGFLRPDLVNADSQRQGRDIDDDYADTHITSTLGAEATLIWGADLLYGRGSQASRNGGYLPDLSGVAPLPATTDLHVDEINGLVDRRVFIGEYLQGDWKIGSRVDLTGGLRLNETRERKQSIHIDGFDASLNTFDDRTRRVTRLSAAAGATYKVWTDGSDEAVLYLQYKNTFKPAALDFGPDNRPGILRPETARSYEAGVKGRLGGGRLDYQAGLFQLDFTDLVVTTFDVDGAPLLQNAGGEKLRGVEAEAHWRVTPTLSLSAAGSYHDARFTRYVAREGGANIDVSGNQLALSPHLLASAGLIYQPTQGAFGSLTVNCIGPRYLDLANTARTGAYATVDATLGLRLRRYSLSFSAANLTDQRPPVTASEFGDQSYYRLPGRRLFIELSADF